MDLVLEILALPTKVLPSGEVKTIQFRKILASVAGLEIQINKVHYYCFSVKSCPVL